MENSKSQLSFDLDKSHDSPARKWNFSKSAPGHPKNYPGDVAIQP
jgi:hypothetical protein